jgi:L-seryl-tRNA(Ser) seleniumtransferase
MISATYDELRERAEAWYRATSEWFGGALEATILAGESAVGGGSLPGETLPTCLLALRVADAEAMASALRAAEAPVVCRVQREQILFDPRTVQPDQDEALVATLKDALGGAIAETG